MGRWSLDLSVSVQRLENGLIVLRLCPQRFVNNKMPCPYTDFFTIIGFGIGTRECLDI